MQIEFFYKASGEVIPKAHWTNNSPYLYIDNDGEVFMDNGDSYESQSASIGFNDFVEYRHDIGWRVVGQ